MGSDSDDEETTTRLQTECVERYKVRNHERIPALNGQYGLRTKCDLAKSTVVGQYIGVEYLESEFQSAFSSAQEALKNVYAFTLSVGDNPTTKKKNKNEDERVENVLFAKVSLNGWPSIFA